MTGKSVTNKRVMDIEQNMVEVRNLFIQIFNKLVKGVKDDTTAVGVQSISVSQLKALSAFHEDREYSMGELSKNALVKMPSMTEMVDRLEQAGFLERVRNASDRRVVNVRLTEKGRTLHEEFISKRRRELCDVFSKLNDADQDELVKSLKKVSTILQKVTID